MAGRGLTRRAASDEHGLLATRLLRSPACVRAVYKALPFPIHARSMAKQGAYEAWAPRTEPMEMPPSLDNWLFGQDETITVDSKTSALVAFANLVAAQINLDHSDRAAEARAAAAEASAKAKAAASTGSSVSAASAAELAAGIATKAAQPHAIWQDADFVFSAPLGEGYERDLHPVFVNLLERLATAVQSYRCFLCPACLLAQPDEKGSKAQASPYSSTTQGSPTTTCSPAQQSAREYGSDAIEGEHERGGEYASVGVDRDGKSVQHTSHTSSVMGLLVAIRVLATFRSLRTVLSRAGAVMHLQNTIASVCGESLGVRACSPISLSLSLLRARSLSRSLAHYRFCTHRHSPTCARSHRYTRRAPGISRDPLNRARSATHLGAEICLQGVGEHGDKIAVQTDSRASDAGAGAGGCRGPGPLRAGLQDLLLQVPASSRLVLDLLESRLHGCALRALTPDTGVVAASSSTMSSTRCAPPRAGPSWANLLTPLGGWGVGPARHFPPPPPPSAAASRPRPPPLHLAVAAGARRAWRYLRALATPQVGWVTLVWDTGGLLSEISMSHRWVVE